MNHTAAPAATVASTARARQRNADAPNETSSTAAYTTAAIALTGMPTHVDQRLVNRPSHADPSPHPAGPRPTHDCHARYAATPPATIASSRIAQRMRPIEAPRSAGKAKE